MKNPALFLFPVLMLAGCTTVVKYDAKTASSPAKPADYPIYIYMENMKIPRPFEVIGTMHVGNTPFTVMGGSLEGVLKTLTQNARQKGADALQITSIEEPGFTSASYRVDARFLRFTEAWESVALSQDELLAYLKNNAQTLDPIEGIWAGKDLGQTRIGIMTNSSKPGRDFIGFILNTKNPTWRNGDKKMDIVRGERRGIYRLDYYYDDYHKEKAVITLGAPPAGGFIVRMPNDSDAVIFSRE